MSRAGSLLMVAVLAGCAPPDRAEIHYRHLWFISPQATGEYKQAHIIDRTNKGEFGDRNPVKQAEMPEVYVRIDGQHVLYLPTLTIAEAAECLPVSGNAPLAPGATSARFFHPEGLDLTLHEKTQSAYVTLGSLSGKHGPGVEIAAEPDGPFYAFPLSRKQIVSMFGEPLDEFARDYPHAN